MVFIFIFRNDGGYPVQRWVRTQKTPEMNELDIDKKSLKLWADNFEKEKNESIFKIQFFFAKKIPKPLKTIWTKNTITFFFFKVVRSDFQKIVICF